MEYANVSFVLGVGPQRGGEPGANRNPTQKDLCQKARAFQEGRLSDKQKWKESKTTLLGENVHLS